MWKEGTNEGNDRCVLLNSRPSSLSAAQKEEGAHQLKLVEIRGYDIYVAYVRFNLKFKVYPTLLILMINSGAHP